MGMPSSRALRHVRHLLLDRGRDDQCRAIGANPAAVLRVYGDAERFELWPQPRALAAVEGPVAAARFAAGHRLELGERAHAGAAEPGVVKPALGPWDRAGRATSGAAIEHEIAFAHAREQLDHVAVRKTHAAMRGGPAEQSLRGWCRADRCSGRASRSPSPRLTPSSSPSRVRMRVRMRSSSRASPHHLSPVLWRETNTAPSAALLADPRRIAMPARRRAERALGAADAVARGRHRPRGDRLSAFEPSGDLTLGIDHEQPRRAAAPARLGGRGRRAQDRARGRPRVCRARPSRAHSATAGCGRRYPLCCEFRERFSGTGKSSCGPDCEL